MNKLINCLFKIYANERGFSVIELLAILAIAILIIGGTFQAADPTLVSWFLNKVMSFFTT